jgi:hypothetical protein
MLSVFVPSTVDYSVCVLPEYILDKKEINWAKN